MSQNRDSDETLREARRVLTVEANAIASLAERVGDDFLQAVDLLEGANGRVIVSGLGKSGIIGRKIAATLTSTGTPAFFLHPVEGLHGDLGVVGPDDVAILISKSGETTEIGGILDHLLRAGVPVVAMTANSASPLARNAAVTLDCTVEEEACPMDLAPTSSTTATLAMGDALAVVLLGRKNFSEEDFARIHPGGSLGRQLTVLVSDVMIGAGFPSLPVDATMRDAIAPLAELRGTVPIVDGNQRVVGVVTAGDLTRLMEQNSDFLDVPTGAVMSSEPRIAHREDLGSAAAYEMEAHGIMALPVVDREGVLVGIVHLHDLMRSGVL